MNQVIKQLKANLLTGGNKTALIYSNGKSYSYAELEQLSGRVCGWLKQHKVGKEDTVLITLPRGIDIIVAMVGVIRAGACYTVCESSMAPERIRYIAENSECKEILHQKLWEEIISGKDCGEFADPDEHDAAYIVYTSGSTGNPKGVVHEYGNYTESIRGKQFDGQQICKDQDILAINSPLNFVAAVDYIMNALYAQATILLVETAIVKNTGKLMELYENYGVTYTFMTPSLYKSVPAFCSTLQKIQLGGEACVGLYNDKIRLFNSYNSSEGGRDLLLFDIDQKYSATPVGQNRGGEEILLLDENGKPVADGEIGEICFVNHYVRGYLGMPEKTAEVWREGLYHTSDLGRRENGNIVLLGRCDDMIKINGNRIEPAEIETVSKKMLHLSNVVVKGFITEERNFIVLYYSDNVELDPQKAREKLARKLTSYMIPAYFVHIDEIPMLPNGKVNKKVLEAPSAEDFRQEYEAPANELEQELVSLFEQVLELSPIGVNDDFYELGGDSLKTIQLIMEYDSDTLNAQTVFKCRTVRRIANEISLTLEEQQNSGAHVFESPCQKEMEARKHKYPLTEFQINMFDYQLYEPTSTMWNLEDMFSFDRKDTDAERLYQAVKTVTEKSAIFRTRIGFDEFCDMVEYMDEEAVPALRRVELSEKEFHRIKNTLNHPFKMIGSPYIEVTFFQTETKIYLHFLAHHLIIDGMGIAALLSAISEVYKGEEMPLDTFYSFLMDTANMRDGRKYNEARKYFEETYSSEKWFKCLEPDSQIIDHQGAVAPVHIPVTEEKIAEIEKSTGLSRNGLSAAAILLAMAAESGEDNVMLSWVYHQRTDLQKKNAIGLLISQLPIGLTMSKAETLGDIYEEVREKINAGMANSIYDWSLRDATGFDDDMMLLVYEGKMFDWQEISQIGGAPVAMDSQFGSSEEAANIRKMFTMAVEDETGITMNLTYLKNAYASSRINRFKEIAERIASVIFSDADPESISVKELLQS
ncbi:MAG: non-ribosomal peptide synthetase [Lachnospiraceae bacterium]|nr:non-ribosomal peptide synthetase [Lachnospiraceae bacterium]